MSVRLNLLPDLRQAKLREQSRRRFVTTVSVVVCVTCVGVIAVLGIYNTTQKLLVSNATGQITEKKSQLTKTDGIIDALTAAEHAAALPDLYAKRVLYSKFFQAYMASSPTTVSIDAMSVDETNSLKVSGSAVNYASVAKLARALEASNVTVGPEASPTNEPYFTNVTILDTSNTGNKVSFSLSASVAPGATNVNR